MALDLGNHWREGKSMLLCLPLLIPGWGHPFLLCIPAFNLLQVQPPSFKEPRIICHIVPRLVKLHMINEGGCEHYDAWSHCNTHLNPGAGPPKPNIMNHHHISSYNGEAGTKRQSWHVPHITSACVWARGQGRDMCGGGRVRAMEVTHIQPPRLFLVSPSPLLLLEPHASLIPTTRCYPCSFWLWFGIVTPKFLFLHLPSFPFHSITSLNTSSLGKYRT